MHTITIRQAVVSDLDALALLFDSYRQFYGGASDVQGAKAFLLARFDHGESALFMAFDGATPVGFTQLYPSFSSLLMARILVLNDLFVDAQARRKGVASSLLAASVAYASALGATSVSLSTAVTNHSAQALYEGAGWKRDVEFFTYEVAVGV